MGDYRGELRRVIVVNIRALGRGGDLRVEAGSTARRG